MVKHSLKDQLILHEGLRLRVYTCTANKKTIGVGRNLEDVGLYPEERDRILGRTGLSRSQVINILEERGITKDEALYMLDNDIAGYTKDVEQFPWFKYLDPVRQKIIVDMCFNLGLAGLKKFRKMIGHLEAGAYSNAAEEMKDSKWYWEAGNRSRRLVKMMATGHDYDPKEKFDLTK
jgi:lysozyme